MNINMAGNGSVTIDGKTFSGRSVSIVNGKVIVDGKTQDGELVGPVTVMVDGDVQSLENHYGNVICNNAGDVSTGSGDVNCGNVSGSIRTGSGGVDCGAVSGNIRTGSGDVCHK